MSILRHVWGLVAMLACTASFGADTRVIYPAYETQTDSRFNDLIEILQTSLEKTVPEFGPFELIPSRLTMNEQRYLAELKNGQLINIAWSSTSVEKETEFLPLRIPLRKGLLGYRIALIAKDNQQKVDQVHTLDDLKTLTIGQGRGWGDVQLYKSNGIRVIETEYANLFKMTNVGRVDMFPRGIGEVFAEFDGHSKENPNLAIEKNLLIYYPWPYYFFFNKNDAALQHRVEVGIHLMMKDGSFEAIFKKFNGKAIAQANFKKRRVIRMANFLLPKETPLGDASLWFDPSK